MASIDYPRVAVVVVLLAVNLALVGALTTSSAAYGPYNPDWDGADTLRTTASEEADVRLAVSTETYTDVPPAGATAFVLAPEAPSEEAAARVQSFVARGGTLVVAGEDANATNGYLDAVGASARVDGRQVRDDQNNYRAPQLPVATNVTEHDLAAGVESLTLNDGTVVEPRGATPLVNTSGVAYVDADGNGTLDATDPFGTFPVATVEPEGSGRIVTVSDPSVFTNAMLDRAGNEAFLRALLNGQSTVLVDYSHRSSLPPLVYALLAVRASPPLQAAVGVAAFGILALYANRRRIAASLPEREADRAVDVTLDEAAVRALLADEHPDWERERVERVTEAVLRQHGTESDND